MLRFACELLLLPPPLEKFGLVKWRLDEPPFKVDLGPFWTAETIIGNGFGFDTTMLSLPRLLLLEIPDGFECELQHGGVQVLLLG